MIILKEMLRLDKSDVMVRGILMLLIVLLNTNRFYSLSLLFEISLNVPEMRPLLYDVMLFYVPKKKKKKSQSVKQF